MSDMDANRLSWDGTKRCSQSVAGTEQFYLLLCVMKEPMHTPQLRWRPQDLGVERVSHLDLGLGFELRLSGLRIKCLTG